LTMGGESDTMVLSIGELRRARLFMQSGSEKKTVVFYCALAATRRTDDRGRMMENRPVLFVFCLLSSVFCFLFFAGNARGDIVKVDLYGEVTSIVDQAGLLGGQVNVGNEITGWYRFDTSTPDSKPLTTEGDYQQTTPLCGISLNINGMLFASQPTNMDFLIKVINDTSSKDSYLLSSTSNLPTAGGLEVSSIHWQLDDSTCSALSSDALVAAIPQQWESNVLDITCRGAGGAARIKAIIPYTEVVPEPASALMISLGFLLIGRRRSKKSNIKK